MTPIVLPNGMVVDQTTLIWMVPLALLILALFQFLYLNFLRYAPTRGEPQPPAQPIMPAVYTQPGGVPVQQQTAMIPVQQQPAVMPQPVQPMPLPPAPVQMPPVVQPPVQPQAQRMPPAPAPVYSGGVVTMGKFIVLSGLESPKEVALPGSNFFIGRFYSPENGVLVALDEKSISRKHAHFTCDESLREYYLKDASSSFGTYVLINGNFEQLNPERQERVYNEDVIQFGNVVTVRLILPCETRAPTTSL